jgi:hypothetical protein
MIGVKCGVDPHAGMELVKKYLIGVMNAEA